MLFIYLFSLKYIMTSKLVMGFEVHQPFRIRKDAFWNPRFKGPIQEKYFDNELNKAIFERVKAKCYIPATSIILEEIEAGEEEGRDVKFFFSISGTLLEQAERWGRDLIELFQLLTSTRKVEFLAQTYYHSVSSLWEDRTEWREQVKLHRETVTSLLGQSPVTFENTELLTNPVILEEAEKMGFKGFMMEGKESVLKGRSPNFVFRRKNGSISILPRNYMLSDDLAFRFSNQAWDQYPLTAEKYASWIKASPGQLVTIFVDYETFGEHQWKESGILEFLRWLPRELHRAGVEMSYPER